MYDIHIANDINVENLLGIDEIAQGKIRKLHNNNTFVID